jgi:hypothetical protein
MPPWVAGATGDGWGAHNDRAEVAARAVARNMRQGRDTKSGGRAGVLVAQLMAAIDQLRLSSSSLSTKPAVICATSVCQDVQHYLTRRNKVDAESARRALSQVDGHKFLARLLDSDEPCVVEAACRALQSLTFEAADIVKGTMSISGVPQRLAVILGKTPAERSGLRAVWMAGCAGGGVWPADLPDGRRHRLGRASGTGGGSAATRRAARWA